jgi:hypothetical protein
MNKNKLLQNRLKNIGQDALLDRPDISTYTHCCGLFINKKSPVIEGRILVLKIIYWLQTLAEETSDEKVLSAALYLADKYTAKHRDVLSEELLFEELDKLKSEYHIHYHQSDMKVLVNFSNAQDHISPPKVIQDYMKHFATNKDSDITIALTSP